MVKWYPLEREIQNYRIMFFRIEFNVYLFLGRSPVYYSILIYIVSGLSIYILFGLFPTNPDQFHKIVHSIIHPSSNARVTSITTPLFIIMAIFMHQTRYKGIQSTHRLYTFLIRTFHVFCATFDS
eukprot:747376_1